MVILPFKLTNILHFDLIFGHLLCLGQKYITMETRNFKYGMTPSFPPVHVKATLQCDVG